VINAILNGKPALVTQGDQYRDFMYVEDVASAFATLLDGKLEGAVNIASGEPIALKTIVGSIAEKLGRPELVQFGKIPTPKTEPHFLLADVNRLRKETEWRPTYDLEAGLKQTVEWWIKKNQETGKVTNKRLDANG
jgi:nucleoside-diphosphate-sugar epimerase